MLSEVLVAMTMMVTVLFALYAIFDTSVRIFRYGNDELEALESARLGLERMEREIRAAYPHDGGTLIDTGGRYEISFRNRPESGPPRTITVATSISAWTSAPSPMMSVSSLLISPLKTPSIRTRPSK